MLTRLGLASLEPGYTLLTPPRAGAVHPMQEGIQPGTRFAVT
jgi:hypothetical protein